MRWRQVDSLPCQSSPVGWAEMLYLSPEPVVAFLPDGSGSVFSSVVLTRLRRRSGRETRCISITIQQSFLSITPRRSKTFGGRDRRPRRCGQPVRQLALSYVAILRAVRRNVK